MAFMGLKVPHETGRILDGIDVPGKREAPSSMHITMFYLGKQQPIENIAKVMSSAHRVLSATSPFTVSTSRVGSFPTNPDDGVPVICRVDSDPLHELHARLSRAFDEDGIEYSKKYPEYKPHVTLAYHDEDVPERRIPKVEWGAHEVVIWGGDEGDRGVAVTFPLLLSSKIASRVMQRFLARSV